MNSNNKQNMKNTMKMKSLLSFFVPAAMMSLMVASCSDYDNGYDSAAIKFNEEFRKAFGEIDPEQDWNLAERGTVTVSTLKESEVKIYALLGGEYCIVGDYEGVNGTQMLGFDMVEGTSSILVTDGETAQKTVPGGVVAFGGTRTTYPGNDVVKINKIENENGLYLETTGKTYPKYVEFNSMDDYSKIFKTVPEIGPRDPRDKTNLNKVPSNFHYTSNGSFIIYPIYWNTSSLNTLGVYYKNGDEIVKVPVYKHKEGNEVQYVGNLRKDADWSNAAAWANAQFDKNSKTLTWSQNITNQVGGLFTKADLSSYKYLTINASIKSGAHYRVYFRKDNNDQGQKIIPISKSGSVTIDLSDVPNGIIKDCEILLSGGSTSSGEVQFTSMYLWNKDVALHNFEGTDEAHYRCDAIFEQGDGKFNGQKILAQGIKVDIPEGTVFGMYLEKTEKSNGKTYTFYSESELNNPESDPSKGVVGVGYGVIDHDNGNVTQVKDLNNPKSHPCYASAFDVDGLQYLGFEDWPNIYNNSDFDLNDMIFAFDGCKPTIINEEPTGGTWLIASEDLGGSFDVDYNDIVFQVEHISGKEYATVTPLAAGGTLASYIFFLDPNNGNNETCLGEIHQMFNMAPQTSGEYSPINVGAKRAEYRGVPVTIKVDKDWTMAYYSTDTWGEGSAYTRNGNAVNMGGFEIRTLTKGTEAPTGEVTIGNSAFTGASRIQPPSDKGVAPYILCLPYYYTRMHMNYRTPEPNTKTKYVWAWPAELVTICNADGVGPYPKFKEWVSDKSKNTWYMEKDNRYSTVSDLYWVSDMTQDEISKNPYNAGGNENGGNNGDDDNGVYQIKTDETCRFTFQNNGVTYALAYDENQSQSANGGLVMKVLDNNDPNQIWCLKVSNNQNYGYLYNYGSEKSIDVDKNSTPWKAGWTEGTPGDMSGRFKLMSSGSGYYLYLRNYEKSDADHQTGPQYIGSDNIGDGVSIWMNKTVAEGKAILWTKSAASAPVINGGGDENTLSYTKQAMTLEADGNDYYTLGSSGHNYIISGSAFSSYSDAITINITGFTGNNLKAFIGSDDLTGFISKNQGDTWSISLTATQVNAVKSSNFTIKSSGDPTLVVKVQ